MSILGNLPISRKLTAAFGIVCMLCTLQCAVAIIGFAKLNGTISDINNNTLPAVELVDQISVSISLVRRTDMALLLCKDANCAARTIRNRERAVKAYASAKEKYEPLISYPGERELYNTFRTRFEDYQKLIVQSHEAAKAGNVDEARALAMADPPRDAIDDAQGAADKDVALNAISAHEEGSRKVHSGHVLQLAIIICGVVTLIMCVITGAVLTKLIAPPLRAAAAALERLADRDLTAHVESHGTDEVGRLSTALNTSVAAIRSVLRTVAQGAESLSAAAEEMSLRSTEAYGNAESQAGKTSQIAAAAQQMTATIREISRNTESAAMSSHTSAETASAGGAVMQATSVTMERIATATHTVAEKMDSLARRSVEIGKVAGVIQEISEQTNLLALNAAIEAARAGEQGRGFAVVAGEVRRLAERTKGATEEIAGTIRSIQEEIRLTVEVMSGSREAVETGIGETASAGASLEAIIESSKQVEDQIKLIAAAATEQTAASGEISESARHISQLAAQNSQAAEETTEACKSLTVLANDLDGMIRQFRIDDDIQPGGKLSHAVTNAASRSYRTA